MTMVRLGFAAEFKCEAVALLASGGRPRMAIAAGSGIQPSLRRRLERGRVARDVLKKAKAIVAAMPT